MITTKEIQKQIDILQGQLDSIQKPIAKGTICKVKHNNIYRIATGNGLFEVEGVPEEYIPWENMVPIEMGLQFSDKTITSSEITEDMDRCLCLASEAGDVAVKTLRVFDWDNRGIFSWGGKYKGIDYAYYKLCITPHDNLPEWAKDMIHNCED